MKSRGNLAVRDVLELLYHAHTEFNSVETLAFKAIVNPLDQALCSLVDIEKTDLRQPGY